MKERLYLRIINTLLLPGLEKIIVKKDPTSSIALSAAASFNEKIIPSLVIKIERLTETIKAGFVFDSHDQAFIKLFKEVLKNNIRKTEFLLKILSEKEIKKITLEQGEEMQGICYKYLMIIKSKNKEQNVEVIIEGRFFNILYPQLKSTFVHENIIKEISPFFEKPDHLWPSLVTVIETLPLYKLSDLFNSMMQKSYITPYQIGAAITLYPDLKNKILMSISKNLQKDISFIFNKYKGLNRITKRDGICAVYAIEEALKKLLLEGTGEYSDELLYISEIFKKIYRYSIFQKKNFIQHINEIEKKNLMDKIIPLCNDKTLRRAFYSSNNNEKNILKKYISEKRINEIFDFKENITFEKKIEAEIEFISAYRKVSVLNLNQNHESFSFLIASMQSKKDFSRLLSETGWYILSTALKGSETKTIKKVTNNLPAIPAAIINDVLKGLLNPDIIHDEKQIFRARNSCVEKILSLYFNCFIDL